MSSHDPVDDRGTIVKVLRHLAGGWVDSRSDQEWLSEVADEIEHRDPADLMTCPLCQEVACDSTCPMRPHRSGHYSHPAPQLPEVRCYACGGTYTPTEEATERHTHHLGPAVKVAAEQSAQWLEQCQRERDAAIRRSENGT